MNDLLNWIENEAARGLSEEDTVAALTAIKWRIKDSPPIAKTIGTEPQASVMRAVAARWLDDPEVKSALHRRTATTEPQAAPTRDAIYDATLRELETRHPIPTTVLLATRITNAIMDIPQCQAESEQPSPATTNGTEERDMTTEYLQGVVDRVSVQRKREEYPDPSPEMLNGDPLFDAIWKAIKGWDISRHNDGLYSGPTGNDARHIYDAITRPQCESSVSSPAEAAPSQRLPE